MQADPPLGPPLPGEQARLGWRDLLSQLFSEVLQAQFHPAVQRESKWACTSTRGLLPVLRRPQQEDPRIIGWFGLERTFKECLVQLLLQRAGTSLTRCQGALQHYQPNHLRSHCRAGQSMWDPSASAEPHDCHLPPLLRVVHTGRAWISWCSPMQINVVACTHTSALIYFSRLNLSFRKLEC